MPTSDITGSEEHILDEKSRKWLPVDNPAEEKISEAVQGHEVASATILDDQFVAGGEFNEGDKSSEAVAPEPVVEDSLNQFKPGNEFDGWDESSETAAPEILDNNLESDKSADIESEADQAHAASSEPADDDDDDEFDDLFNGDIVVEEPEEPTPQEPAQPTQFVAPRSVLALPPLPRPSGGLALPLRPPTKGPSLALPPSPKPSGGLALPLRPPTKVPSLALPTASTLALPQRPAVPAPVAPVLPQTVAPEPEDEEEETVAPQPEEETPKGKKGRKAKKEKREEKPLTPYEVKKASSTAQAMVGKPVWNPFAAAERWQTPAKPALPHRQIQPRTRSVEAEAVTAAAEPSNRPATEPPTIIEAESPNSRKRPRGDETAPIDLTNTNEAPRPRKRARKTPRAEPEETPVQAAVPVPVPVQPAGAPGQDADAFYAEQMRLLDEAGGMPDRTSEKRAKKAAYMQKWRAEQERLREARASHA